MVETLSVTEVAALTGLDEARVRKEVEHGLFAAPRFSFVDAVYFRMLVELDFKLGVEDRRRLHSLLVKAVTAHRRVVEFSPILTMSFDALLDEVRTTLDRFEAWKKKLVSDPGILGGESVFPQSRLGVRHVGTMVLRGATAEEIREDYSYLDEDDVRFAKLYAIAYPRVGRPRETPAR